MKRYAKLTKQGIAFLLIFILVFSFTNKPKQAEAIDVSGLGSTIMGCANIGDTISDFVMSLGKKDGIEGIGGRGNDTGIEKSIKVLDKQATKSLEKQERIATRQERTTNCLNGIAYVATKNALAVVTQKTVNWTNTGLNGNPLYVVDSQSFFQQLQERELNSFINDLSSAGNAFGNQIAKELIQNQQAKNDRNLRELRTDQKQKTGFTSAEFEEDFNNGGWNGFLNYNLNSANNPLGSRFVAQQKLGENQARATDAQKDELLWNNGFLNIKKCADRPSNSAATDGTDSSITPTKNTNKGNCRTFETQTPGVIIQNQLALALGTPTRLLENADQINETLGSVFDSLVNNLFNKGLNDLGKAQQEAGYGFGANNGFLQGDTYSGSNIATLGGTATGNLYNYETSWFGINGDFDIRDMRQFDLIIKTQKDYIAKMADSLPFLDKIIGPIARLDMCIPGPNAIWPQETAEKVGALADEIAGRTFNDNAPQERIRKGIVAVLSQVADGITIKGFNLGWIEDVGTILTKVFGKNTRQENINAENKQAEINFIIEGDEYESNQYRLAEGILFSFTEYSEKIKTTFPNDENSLLPVALDANPIVANLRNYDTNITDLKELYFQRKQETLLMISRLNDLQSKIKPMVQAARQRAFTWNRINCPIAEASDPGGELPMNGTGTGSGGTDSGGGGVDPGPGSGGGTGAGTGTVGHNGPIGVLEVTVITSPVQGQVVQNGSSLQITVDAPSTATKVALSVGLNLYSPVVIGTDTTAPFVFNWIVDNPGTFHFTATSYNGTTLLDTSPAVSITSQ